MAINPLDPGKDLYEGVNLLRALMDNIISGGKVSQAA
jgi:hypothetical protein